MGTATKSRLDIDNDMGQPSQTARTIVSLVVFIHLFCVLAALYGRQAPSPSPDDMLKDRLREKLAIYTQTFGFETTARFDLTQATIFDVDHRIEFLSEGKNQSVDQDWELLRTGMRGGDRYLRYQRLADLLAFLGPLENDERGSILTADIGKHLLNQRETKVGFLRSRRHLVQRPIDLNGTPAERDPNDRSRFEQVYSAQLIDFGGGDLRPQKVEERGQVAPPTRGRN